MLSHLSTQVESMIMKGQNESESSWMISLLWTFATTKAILTFHAFTFAHKSTIHDNK